MFKSKIIVKMVSIVKMVNIVKMVSIVKVAKFQILYLAHQLYTIHGMFKLYFMIEHFLKPTSLNYQSWLALKNLLILSYTKADSWWGRDAI